jgi:hypothetical protein
MNAASLIACTRCATLKARCDRKVSQTSCYSSTEKSEYWTIATAPNAATRCHALNVSQETMYANQGAPRAGEDLLGRHLRAVSL